MSKYATLGMLGQQKEWETPHRKKDGRTEENGKAMLGHASVCRDV